MYNKGDKMEMLEIKKQLNEIKDKANNLWRAL